MLKAMGVQQFWPQSAEDVAQADAPPQAVLVDPMVPSPVPVHMPEHEGARPEAGTLAWPELIASVLACRACGLCNSRKQAVVGVGHPQAEWMLVGEAPGEQEDIQGEPFVGRAGQLLDRMLAATGLTRETASSAQQVYIANVIKCRPPGNRNPTPEEVQQCEPYLARQVQLVKPKLLVAMGRFAAHALLKTSDPIGRLRGRVHTYEGTPLVVTYHPAYLLRNPADKALAWDDWCLAREAMAGLR
jgi:DNA polymerase